MKLQITVLIPSNSYLRTDLKNWDKYGAGEALDSEMTLFNPSVFVAPKSGLLVAESTKNNYSWGVQIVPNLNYYPVIKFYDTDKGVNVATITGTPKERGTVQKVIQNLLNGQTSQTGQAGQTETGARSVKITKAGIGWLSALFLLTKLKKADSVGYIVNKNSSLAKNICNNGRGTTAQAGACAWNGGININESKKLRLKKLK